MKFHLALVAATALTFAAAGCGYDPDAPLIPVPDRGTVVDAATVSATGPDGFPNVLVDPVVFEDDVRTSAEIAAEEAALARRSAGLGAEAAAVVAGESEAEWLRRRAASHAAEAEATISASGRAARP